MKELSHNTIDVLKLNIEGAEVESLNYMIKNTKIRPKLICVKFELRREEVEKNLQMN